MCACDDHVKIRCMKCHDLDADVIVLFSGIGNKGAIFSHEKLPLCMGCHVRLSDAVHQESSPDTIHCVTYSETGFMYASCPE